MSQIIGNKKRIVSWSAGYQMENIKLRSQVCGMMQTRGIPMVNFQIVQTLSKAMYVNMKRFKLKELIY